MRLTDEEESMRAGRHGPALQWAIDHQINSEFGGKAIRETALLSSQPTCRLKEPISGFTIQLLVRSPGSKRHAIFL